jgi:hypothetical protein
MEYNDDGWIALKRFQTIPRLVTVGDDQYAFQCRNNICMAWVRPEHVNQVLSVMKMCCGNSKKPMFTYASETDVRRWQYGGR